VSSASRILGRPVGFGEAEEALIHGFSQALDLELIPGEPAAAELERAEELARDKFDSEAWKGRR